MPNRAATAAELASYRPPRAGTAYGLVLEHLGARIDHAGRIAIPHVELGARVGRCKRQVQNIVHALERAGYLRIEARRGYANVYRVLVRWVLRMLEGEAREAPAPERVTFAPEAVWQAPAEPAYRPPPRIFPNGGCIHSVPACEACRG